MATLKLKSPRNKEKPELSLKERKKLNKAIAAEQFAKAAERRGERNRLAEAWLQTFPPYASFLPLAIKFKNQLPPRPEGVSSVAFQHAVRKHVRSLPYLYALSLPDSKRYNLDGSISGDAAWSEREYAKELLETLHGVE